MAKKSLTEKELLFCKYMGTGLFPFEAAAKSGYIFPQRAALKLMGKKDILSEIKKNAPSTPKTSEIAAGLRRLAFGSVADVIRLITAEDIKSLNPDELELSAITELKFSKGGGIEVKLCDRIKALDALKSLADGEEKSDGGLFEALEKSAEMLGSVREE